MNKLLVGIVFFMGAMMFGGLPLDAKAELPSLPEEGFDCKIEIIRCNWYNADVRQICHQNGDGISCICGESTSC